MNSMKVVIPFHSLYWSIHTKDESKRGTAFAFIFGVNWLWRWGVTALFGVFFHEIKCNGITSFMEFIISMAHTSLCLRISTSSIHMAIQMKWFVWTGWRGSPWEVYKHRGVQAARKCDCYWNHSTYWQGCCIYLPLLFTIFHFQ